MKGGGAAMLMKFSPTNSWRRGPMKWPAVQAFSLSAQFARKSTMLKLPKERRKWGESKGVGRGWGERRENACPKTL